MSYTELKQKKVTCRKNHFCTWCNETINKGDEAETRVYVWSGDFHSEYMHPECFNDGFKKEDREVLEEGFEPGSYKRGSLEQR